MNAEQIGGVVRAVVAALGGVAVGKGLIDQETVLTVAGAIGTIVVAVWSVMSKGKTPT